MLDPGNPPGQEPRVLVPVKFTREKTSFKWKFLINKNSKQVFTRYIGLSPYKFPALKNNCEGIFKKGNNGTFEVPYACVAMVDEYNADKNRSLEEVMARARKVDERMNKCKASRDEAVEAYLDHYKAVYGKEGNVPGKGRGQKRRVFKDLDDEVLYNECIARKQKLDRWKDEKVDLLRSLMFFAISLSPGEDPSADPLKFIAFARDYHERWGEEIGFKDVKARFLGEHRSRKPVIRSFHLVVGMMLYNRWQVERGKIAVDILTNRGDPYGPPDASRPHIRRKIEKECDCLPTAVRFLVDCWREALLSVIKKNIWDEK
jgi:hypothetical protein